MIEGMMAHYDKQMLPNPRGVNVTIEIHIQEIASLSEISSDFELDLFYSEIWLDPMLNFSNFSACKTNVTLKPEFRERIWRPDTCIVNSKKAEIHSSPSENSFVILYEDGTVWVNYRMLVSFKVFRLKQSRQKVLKNLQCLITHNIKNTQAAHLIDFFPNEMKTYIFRLKPHVAFSYKCK